MTRVSTWQRSPMVALLLLLSCSVPSAVGSTGLDKTGTRGCILWCNESQVQSQKQVMIHRSFETERAGLSADVKSPCLVCSLRTRPDAQANKPQ